VLLWQLDFLFKKMRLVVLIILVPV
jgi:hypothetical protein